MTYQTEFRDYDDVLPDLSPLEDHSWHNDACPSFAWEDESNPVVGHARIELWCDYRSPERRESAFNPPSKRFNVLVRNRLTGDVIASPIKAETVEELREACKVEYEKHLGVPPANGDDMPIGSLVQCVGFLVAQNKPQAGGA